MLVIFDSKKEVVKEIIKHTKGGRGALAGAIGLSETSFNNRMYERNGCRFFEDEDLDAMDIHAGTTFVAQYRANLRGGLFIPLPEGEVDTQDLSELLIREAASIGALNVVKAKSIEDGFIDDKEKKEIQASSLESAVQILSSSLAFLKMYGRNWK
ncbi:MAG: YmfL family putative regulatory protein [Vibrio sp.]